MRQEDLQFLKDLTHAPSPSGYEIPAANVMRKRIGDVADTVETDILGSVHAMLFGREKGLTIMLAGHLDEIGMIVKYINKDGFIGFDAIGSIDAAVLPGQRVNIHTTSRAMRGIICRKPIHMLRGDEKNVMTPIRSMFIDCGFSKKAEAEKHIRVGDPITFANSLEVFGDDHATSRSFDNKVGVWIATRVMEEVYIAGRASGNLIVVGSTQEEIGMRGGITSTYHANPDIGIAVDVSHATDYPGVEEYYGDYQCGLGPIITRGPNINPIIFDSLLAAAHDEKIPHQIDAHPSGTGTDANAIQLSRDGKATGLISIPLRYMHTPSEVLSLSDLEHAVSLLTRFILDVKISLNLVPR